MKWERLKVDDDRRSEIRIDAYAVGLQVCDGINDELLGIVGNLSQSGLMLIARRELHPEGILQLRLDAPAECGGARIPVGAKVLWCTPANSPDEHWAGLEIIDIAEPDSRALHELLTRLADA